MRFLNFLLISTVLTITLLTTSTQAATFEIQNNCAYTVWAAATPGGGRRLTTGQTWTVNVAATTAGQTGRIWARTNCTFNSNGTGSCQTGDCGGILRCTVDGVHAPPVTLAEYSLNGFNNQDFLDISLLYGFNVPMEFSRPSIGCTGGIRCAADIKRQCPPKLRAPGGCNSPCTVFNTGGYCCTSSLTCERTYLARFFKDMCPNALSYPTDDQSSIYTCPAGGTYRVVFCP
ncbi:protein P21-like [Coffea arabica]|uniref:Protein P21-like n=1 Tax=Coffea arabica TaxID=13443 RepID=A0A6P6TRM3_COFAR|nr:protein P21-like [Coffea arabica]